jgi:hypothetical protein
MARTGYLRQPDQQALSNQTTFEAAQIIGAADLGWLRQILNPVLPPKYQLTGGEPNS